ncbi:PAS domain S-box protein [Elioraea tepidiphila]|jgi:PAS domain S-box-containing protein|uniref:PAS domain S-box protein n=1 Tax=Elioraea tepidiphila TaxID=457934 RepID=UPI002FDAA484
MLDAVIPALERDGLALVVIASTDRRVIDANAVLARVSGFAEAMLRERGLALLACPDSDPATLARLDAAIAAGSELRDEICWARADGTRFWFGFTVIPLGAIAGGGPAVLFMGRDITERRRRDREDATIQAVLTEVFRNLDVAAAVIMPNDCILVANPAYAALTGYAMGELPGLSVDRLTAPASLEEARSRRAEQRRTGGRYRMPLLLRRKDGSVIPVLIHAVAVEHEGTRFRVVTLHAEHGHDAASPERRLVVGQVALIRLDPLRAAYGERWAQVESRLMMLAESVIKRRLEPGDVYARTDSGGFAIWFARGTELDNADRIAAITREIRIRLVGEYGGEHAPGVTGHAAAVPADGIDVPPDRATLVSTLMERLAARQAELRAQVLAELEQALAAPRVVPERLISAGGGGTALVWMTLAPELRRRIEAAHALAGETTAGLPDHDIVLLGAAAEQALSALAAGDRTPAALPVAYETFAAAARRRGVLAACRGLPAPAREILTPVLEGIPSGTNPVRLMEIGQELAPLFSSVGLMAEGAALPDLPPGLGPFTLIVFEGAALRALPEARLGRLFGEARMRRLRVAVRQAGPQAQRLARLGAQFLGVAA